MLSDNFAAGYNLRARTKKFYGRTLVYDLVIEALIRFIMHKM